jgi:LacI family transcriptional regulator
MKRCTPKQKASPAPRAQDKEHRASSSQTLMPAAPAFPTPERRSLIDQTLQAIRSRIEARVWDDKLPGERYFCELLQVSRPTVRSALAILEKEGVISVTRGTNRVLNHSTPSSKRRPESDRHVIVLSPDPRHQMHPTAIYLVDEIHTHLEKVGFRLSVESPAWLSYQDPTPYLEKYVTESPVACWALFSVSEAVQRWFSKKQVPALVSGSCYESVALPSLDFDYVPVTNHAVATFLNKGCKSISLLVGGKLRPGDVATMTAFNEAMLRHSETSSSIIRVAAEKIAFEQQLDATVRASSGKQGLFVFDALVTLHTVTYLLQKNCRIGTDFAIISRDEDFYLDHLVPSPARYRIDKKNFASKFCRKLLQLAQTGNLGTKNTLIIPDFYPGETL